MNRVRQDFATYPRVEVLATVLRDRMAATLKLNNKLTSENNALQQRVSKELRRADKAEFDLEEVRSGCAKALEEQRQRLEEAAEEQRKNLELEIGSFRTLNETLKEQLLQARGELDEARQRK